MSSAVIAWAQPYAFTRIAGVRPPCGAVDGVGPWARFNTPGALAIDSSGNLYVADVLNHAIRKVSPGGSVTTLAGLAGAAGSADGVGADARFNEPWGIAVDANGIVWVADYGNHTIRRIAADGSVTTFAGEAGVRGSNDGAGATAHFDSPAGIAVDAAGNIYVSDRGNDTIRRITPDGTVTTLAGVAGLSGNVDGAGSAARFTSVAGLAIDASGTLYIADSGSHVVRKMTPNGYVSTLAGSAMSPGSADGTGASAQFNGLRGLGVDSGGNVYVADSLNHTIRKVAPNGTTVLLAGTPGIPGNDNGVGTAAQFFVPTGIVADASGNLYVADAQNHSLRKIAADGTVSLYAGGGGSFGSADGGLDIARTHLPRSIGLGPNGALYVTDDQNATVRQITTGGVARTVAGLVRALANIDGTGTAARFGNPFGVAVDANGTSWVSDYTFNVIRKLTPDGAVQTFAGVSSTTGGFSDGAAGTGRLNHPKGVALDPNGNLYVADSGNHVIRKIAPDGTMATLAGGAGVSGYVDGSGASARFNAPSGIAIDATGTLYVSDTGNAVIRKITADGTVTTFAGSPGVTGSADGNGTGAQFLTPTGLAVDGAGNVFVTDTDNETIRKITPDGTVTTIGGTAGVFGSADGTGSAAEFYGPTGITVDAHGTLYIVDSINSLIVKGTTYTAPTLVAAPDSLSVRAGSDAILSVSAAGAALSYQWQLNGAPIAGATENTYRVSNVQAGQTGAYTVVVTNPAGSVTATQSLAIAGNATVDGYLSDVAIRGMTGQGNSALAIGLTLPDQTSFRPAPLMITTIAARLGVPDALSTPVLGILDGLGSSLAVTGSSAAPYGVVYDPGQYTVNLQSPDQNPGVTLNEIFDATPAFLGSGVSRLSRISARGTVGSGNSVLTGGFVLAGDTARMVLIRVIGPSLDPASTSSPLADPLLRLYTGTGEVAENDDWNDSSAIEKATESVGLSPLPAGTKDSALLLTLSPGYYTFEASGVGGNTGTAQFELYMLP